MRVVEFVCVQCTYATLERLVQIDNARIVVNAERHAKRGCLRFQAVLQTVVLVITTVHSDDDRADLLVLHNLPMSFQPHGRWCILAQLCTASCKNTTSGN